MKICFDNDKYLELQSASILERAAEFDNKLYLEFGGKIIYDYHAARVLPGFHPNVKMNLLRKLKDKADIILCIYSGDIERRKIRADFGITYDVDAQKLIDDLREYDLNVKAVVITRFEGQPAAVSFRDKLERRSLKVYTHRFTKGYPTDVDLIVSSKGYGANDYIETDKPLVIVTGPGPGSGKLATCLSQMYHESRRGIKAGYAKFETFPIWNIPLKHPVNVAYEAATADLKDINLIDPFHLTAYGKQSVNYNRDVEIFPVLKRILEKISAGESIYQSPTDMGVNQAGFAIIDDQAAKDAANQEIIRRYFRYKCEYALGLTSWDTIKRAELIMNEMNLKEKDRQTVEPARAAARLARKNGKGNAGIFCGAAVCLDDKIITGVNSEILHAASSLVLNSIKVLAAIPDEIHLLSPLVIESIFKLKKDILKRKTLSLDLEETLIALSISATTNPTASFAMEKLKDLAGCDVHMTHMPTPGDETGLRRLGVNLTSDPNFSSSCLFMS